MNNIRFDYNFDGSWIVNGPPPRNWKEISIELIFDREMMQYQLNSIVFEFVNIMADRLKAYVNAGLTGGTGLFEGPGLRIYVGTAATLIFDGCINTADPDFEIQTGRVFAPIRESGRIDWLNDVGESITFEFLTSLDPGIPGRITRSDYKQTPYCISDIPNYTQAAMLSISLFIVIKEAVDVICKIESIIARLIGQGLSWFQLIMTIVELIIYVIYLVCIIFASARLMQDLLDAIIQPKKTKLCMREADLFIKGLEYFGLKFQSSIYGVGTAAGYNGRYVNATLMPKKIVKPKGDVNIWENYFRPPDETTEPDSYGYYEGTFAQFVRDMEMVYNAKLIIRNGIAYFEEKNSYNTVGAFALPNQGPVGFTFNYQDPHATNADEIPIVYVLQFQKDDQETNTYNDYTGTYAVAQVTPLVVREKKNLLFNNAVNVQLPFALARRKMSMSKIERLLLETLNDFNRYVNDVFRLHNKVNDWLNTEAPGGVSDANGQVSNADLVAMFTGSNWIQVAQIDFGSGNLPNIPPYSFGFADDRHGWMLLSNDFIGVPKRFLGVQNGDDWYIDILNQDSDILSTVDVTTISGVFTGNGSGGVSGPFSGNVVNGFISGSIVAGGIGFTAGVITGTISGQTGIFQLSVHGFISAGHLIFSVFITPVSTTGTYVNGGGSAMALMQDFHYTNLIGFNQWKEYNGKKFRFTEHDFNSVQDKNVLTVPDGRAGKFLRVLWQIHKDYIDCDFRIHDKFTNNYKLTITTDGG